MNQKRIDEIRAREVTATPGPWKVEKFYNEEPYEKYIKSANVICQPDKESQYIVTRNDWSNPVKQDLEFISHSREDIPFLLLEIERLSDELKLYKQMFSDRTFWMKHTLYGDDCVIPVRVIGIEENGFIVRWQITDDYYEDFEEFDATDLFHSQEDAEAALEKEQIQKLSHARPLSEWGEDYGDVLWWKFPIEESPYVGSPLCNDWTDYHTHYYTHWTLIIEPELPEGD